MRRPLSVAECIGPTPATALALSNSIDLFPWRTLQYVGQQGPARVTSRFPVAPSLTR